MATMANRTRPEFGAILRRIKDEHNWTLADMAEASGFASDHTRFSPMMRGMLPSRRMLEDILSGPGFQPYARELWRASGYRPPAEYADPDDPETLLEKARETVGDDEVADALKRLLSPS